MRYKSRINPEDGPVDAVDGENASSSQESSFAKYKELLDELRGPPSSVDEQEALRSVENNPQQSSFELDLISQRTPSTRCSLGVQRAQSRCGNLFPEDDESMLGEENFTPANLRRRKSKQTQASN